MSTQWWYEDGGQVKGPLGSDELRSLVETGTLARGSRVIVVGGSEWGTVEEHALELGVAPVPGPAPGEAGEATTAPPGPGSPAGGPPSPTAAIPAPKPAEGPLPGAGPPAPSGAGATGTPPLVSNGKRFGAYALDGVIFLVSAITLFLGWFVWAFIIFGKGQTPGKQLLGIRVVDASTRRVVSYGTMALRTLVYQLLLGTITFGVTTVIGAIMVLVDENRRQGLWDRLANTVVVDDPDGRTL